ncbi:MAG: chemotaxis protein CheW, partial [Thiopseudomonas sp.]|nr:chemotaxis protein CheW [Thiopseudomonas sp.]
MASILDSVDQRTQLVGENRLEILMFSLHGRQLFAINVFKVQEVVRLPKLTLIPQRHPHMCGVITLRGKTIPVIDLA